jgi:hypothetical protein
MRLGCIIMVSVCLALATVAHADIVYLNTGGVVKGRIIRSDDSEITVRTEHGETTVSRDEVEKIEECESVADLYYEKLEKVEQGSAQAHFDLGAWLKSINEPELARDEFEKAIIIDGDHSGARSELGYVRKGDKWVKKDAKPLAPRVVVKRGKPKEEDPADEHNLLSGATQEVRKLIGKLDSTLESEREEALQKLAAVFRHGDVQAVGEYMRYREAKIITSLQWQEGEILNLLHGQLDEDLYDREVRWFERFTEDAENARGERIGRFEQAYTRGGEQHTRLPREAPRLPWRNPGVAQGQG